MRHGDKQIGSPYVDFTDTKANIEAIASPIGGMTAYASDTGESGHYDGVALEWVWGGGGGSGTVTSVAVSGSDGIEVDSGSPITTNGTIALGINKTTLLSHINVEDGADVTDAINVASVIHGVASKTTPVDNDEFALVDSAASNALKKLTWANLKATLKAYFDGIYPMTVSAQTITTGDVTGAENTEYNCTIAGLTANRNLTLPVASAAGQTIRVNILDGDSTYALIILGVATVTINGGSAAAEWSRLFIAGESVTFRSTSTTNWQVVIDARKPCIGLIERTSTQTIANDTNVQVQLNSSAISIGDVTDTTNYRVTIRRGGSYKVTGFTSLLNLDDQEYVLVRIKQSGTTIVGGKNFVSSASANETLNCIAQKIVTATVGQYFDLEMRHNEGASQGTSHVQGNDPYLLVEELL